MYMYLVTILFMLQETTMRASYQPGAGSNKMRENTETIQYDRLAQIFGVYFTNESDRADDTFV